MNSEQIIRTIKIDLINDDYNEIYDFLDIKFKNIKQIDNAKYIMLYGTTEIDINCLYEYTDKILWLNVDTRNVLNFAFNINYNISDIIKWFFKYKFDIDIRNVLFRTKGNLSNIYKRACEI